jgi:hypothetical protein
LIDYFGKQLAISQAMVEAGAGRFLIGIDGHHIMQFFSSDEGFPFATAV